MVILVAGRMRTITNRSSYPRQLQPNAWSHVWAGWNTTHASVYVNATLCGTSKIENPPSPGERSNLEPGEEPETPRAWVRNESEAGMLLIGAWRGSGDGSKGAREGYYSGLLDNVEV